ncbi:hypothetical protein DIPPA_53486 [Diplonema papillatum]|nr:hypothetical protein DIPPA_53486 [Diplonema papillatum]
MNEVSQALALQQAQLEPVSAGSAAVALTGLVILPFEPFTGATLLAAGMGVSGASVVRGLAQSKQVAEGDLADAKGKLQELNVRLEGERQKAVEAHEREETLAFENRQLQRAVLGGSLIVASLGVGYWIYRNYYLKPPRKQMIGRETVLVTHDIPLRYEPRQAAEGESCCIVCHHNVPDVLLKPCRHMMVCWDCMTRLLHAECPTCRAHVRSVDFVYSG